jgi:hypothetical protein
MPGRRVPIADLASLALFRASNRTPDPFRFVLDVSHSAAGARMSTAAPFPQRSSSQQLQ